MAKSKQRNWYELLVIFQARYGDNDSKLEKWKRLCQDCNVEAGSSITQCKKILQSINVNIVDLLETNKKNQYPVLFRNRRALIAWSQDNDKIFPKRLAKQNKFLQALLVQMSRPQT